MSTAEGYLAVHRTSDEAEAGFMASMLEEVGIRCIVQQEPPSFMSTQPTFLVLVHAAQFPEAKQMVEEQLLAEPGAPAWPGAGGQPAPAMQTSTGLPREETSTWRFVLLLVIAVVILLILAYSGQK